MIVSNTTPLINFSATNQLDILQELFHNITIPLAVKAELEEKIDIFPNIKSIFNSNFIEVKEIQNRILYDSLKMDLDEGESEAITLAIENNAKLILLDEINGRTIADYRKLIFMGSIGCLILAKKKGLLKEIKTTLDDFKKYANFWINPDLYNQVLKSNNEL